MLVLATVLSLLPLAFSQEDDRPFRPTVEAMQMAGTGCPVGGAGIMSGLENNTPIFKYPLWNLSLDDLDPDAIDPETGKPQDTVDKFCHEQITLTNSPPGYQVQINKMAISGPAMLEEGSILGILVQTRYDDELAGEEELFVEPSDLTDGRFVANVTLENQGWSKCVGEDGVVPIIHITTTLALWREGEGNTDSKGSVGIEDGDTEDGVSTHFESIWRKCE